MSQKAEENVDFIESPCGCELSVEEVRTLIGRYGFVCGGGRPREADRCACQRMTKARALARGHKCTYKDRVKEKVTK